MRQPFGSADVDVPWRSLLWRQFGAAIDMFDNALKACPDELWSGRLWNTGEEPPGSSEFWYVAYHTLFWLDLYLSGSLEGFAPPPPYTLDEMDPAGLLPERRYTRDELRSYLDHDRRKCREAIETLTDERALRRCKFRWFEMSYAELLLDNLRHVQEHGAQLNLFLGQQIGRASNWVAQAQSPDTRTDEP